MNFAGILNDAVNLGNRIYNTMGEVYELFTQPISITLVDFINTQIDNPILETLIKGITYPLAHSIFADYSLVTFMFGAGLAFYVMWTLASWVLNLIT